MTGETYQSVGLQGVEIAAVSVEPGGLDDLAGTSTVTVDAVDLTLLPAFADSHEHLMEASPQHAAGAGRPGQERGRVHRGGRRCGPRHCARFMDRDVYGLA
jgi:imidazolonepropionase-like amidohydrolase